MGPSLSMETVTAPEGWLLKYRADRRSVALVMASFAMRLGVFLFVTPWVGLLLLPVLMVPSVMVAAYNHHHQHVNTFRSPVLNRLYDIVLALQTGIGPYGWVLHHNLGHHKNYLNQPPEGDADESHWARHGDGSTMGRIEYTLHTFLYHQVEIFKVGRKHPEVLRWYLGMKVPHYAVVALGLWWNPLAFVVAFMIPGAITLLHTCWATYEHHSGQYTKDHYEASTNREHPLFNVLTCNLGLHTAHHMNP
ncbi:MAG: fatty acid desaturase, partial [Myxococcales bacterium]|nr:fatty acid desaturase [Myxococcales bacterium]